MSEEIKLLSCPFCGERNAESWQEQGKHFVYCQSCIARGPFSMKRNPKDAGLDAITAWNTRVTDKDSLTVEELTADLNRIQKQNISIQERNLQNISNFQRKESEMTQELERLRTENEGLKDFLKLIASRLRNGVGGML